MASTSVSPTGNEEILEEIPPKFQEIDQEINLKLRRNFAFFILVIELIFIILFGIFGYYDAEALPLEKLQKNQKAEEIFDELYLQSSFPKLFGCKKLLRFFVKKKEKKIFFGALMAHSPSAPPRTLNHPLFSRKDSFTFCFLFVSYPFPATKKNRDEKLF